MLLKRLTGPVLLFPAKVLQFDAGLEKQHTKIPSHILRDVRFTPRKRTCAVRFGICALCQKQVIEVVKFSIGQSGLMQSDCPAGHPSVGYRTWEPLQCVASLTYPLASVAERRNRAPAEQAEERVVFSTWHDDRMCFICYRVTDMPTPRAPSVQRPCAGCGAPIWVAKKSPTALPKICIRCTGPSA